MFKLIFQGFLERQQNIFQLATQWYFQRVIRFLIMSPVYLSLWYFDHQSLSYWFGSLPRFPDPLALAVCFAIRYLSSCGILMTRMPPLRGVVAPGRSVALPARSFFNLADSFSKRKEYSERRIIGWVGPVRFHLRCRNNVVLDLFSHLHWPYFLNFT